MSVLMKECRSSEEYQVVFTTESSLEPIAKILSQRRHKPLDHLSSYLQGQMEAWFHRSSLWRTNVFLGLSSRV